MRRAISVLLLLVITSFAVMAIDLLPYKNGIKVDANAEEWPSTLPYFNKKANISYSVANDINGLYFIFKTSDEKNIRQILKNGFEVWIDRDSKKNRNLGVTFPMSAAGTVKKEIDPFAIESTEKKEVKLEPIVKGTVSGDSIKLTGFLLENGVRAVKSCEVKVAAVIDESGTFIYELAVPFNTFYKETLDSDDSKLKYSFGFVLKDVEIELSGNMMPMVMMRGYGMMGGAPGGMNRSMNNIMKTDTPEKEFWLKGRPSLK